jgi:hypothetical protein
MLEDTSKDGDTITTLKCVSDPCGLVKACQNHEINNQGNYNVLAREYGKTVSFMVINFIARFLSKRTDSDNGINRRANRSHPHGAATYTLCL